jgi:hypothetical protein
MKIKILSFLAAAILAGSILSGCVRLPNSPEFSNVPSASHPDVTLPDTGLPGSSHAATASKPVSPAHKAIQTTINWFTTLIIFAGLAAIGWGAFSIYGGQTLAGIRWILLGVLAPIVAIWFAFHWVLVVSVVLICGAFYLLIRYHILSKVKPALSEVESEVKSVLPTSASTPAPTPAKAVASTQKLVGPIPPA